MNIIDVDKNKKKLCKVYRELTSEERKLVNDIKDKAAEMLDLFDYIGSEGTIELAKNKLEEAVMWAVKYVVRDRPSK
jgi:hypothetical protein